MKKNSLLVKPKGKKFVFPFLHFMDKEKMFCISYCRKKLFVSTLHVKKMFDLFLILKKIAWFGVKFVTPLPPHLVNGPPLTEICCVRIWVSAVDQ